MKRRKSILITVIALLCFILTLIFILVWNGVILLNNPSTDEYPVQGVDVSSYQGDISWETLAQQNISFAFIKATEGSSYVDEYFEYNFNEAQKTNLRISAYHFFSFDSAGETQADNFIKNVPKIENMLPPVVDFEFYGDKEKNPPNVYDVKTQLDAFISRLEEHYEMKPIIYSTEKVYEMYLANSYQDYDIWIRNVITKPKLVDSRKWTFWQFTNRKKLSGYNGVEKFIDVNVFYGSVQEFLDYAK